MSYILIECALHSVKMSERFKTPQDIASWVRMVLTESMQRENLFADYGDVDVEVVESAP